MSFKAWGRPARLNTIASAGSVLASGLTAHGTRSAANPLSLTAEVVAPRRIGTRIESNIKKYTDMLLPPDSLNHRVQHIQRLAEAVELRHNGLIATNKHLTSENRRLTVINYVLMGLVAVLLTALFIV